MASVIQSIDIQQSLVLGVLALGVLFTLRQLFILISAEQGRKKDLVRKLYKSNSDFHISVLIAVTGEHQLPCLKELLQALGDQQYPVSRLAIHLVASPFLADDITLFNLPPNVKIWPFPGGARASEGQMTAWLIERCLAAGGTTLFAFLKPEDIVKPDFCQNIVARSYEHHVLQGFVASRQLPSHMLGKILALHTRLWNRIYTAGRFHLGQDTILQDSGWVVKRDVLEKIPYHRGNSLDNLEYTLRLHLHHIPITWAPSMVIYRLENRDLFHYIPQWLASALDRGRLVLQYGFSLISQGILRLSPALLEDALAIVRPSAFTLGVSLLALAVLITRFSITTEWNGVQNTLTGSTWVTPLVFLTAAVLVLHVFGLLVARCRPKDYLISLVMTPVVFSGGICLLPFVCARSLYHAILHQAEKYRSQSVRIGRRFNEELDAHSPRSSRRLDPDAYDPMDDIFSDHHRAHFTKILDEVVEDQSNQAFQAAQQKTLEKRKHGLLGLGGSTKPKPRPRARSIDDEFDRDEFTPNGPEGMKEGFTPHAVPAAPAPLSPTPKVKPSSAISARSNPDIGKTQRQTFSIPLAMGEKQVLCDFTVVTTVDEVGQPRYQMTLHYKTAAFSTKAYKIPDQAYYELLTKLRNKGLSLISCGSCGYFHNPTADVPGMVKNAGVCLFGKAGKEVDLKLDSVTVVSPSCPNHCAIDHREGILKAWQASLDANLDKPASIKRQPALR